MYIRMGTYLNQHTYSSLAANGGSCAITVTQKSGSLVTGTYTATLVSTDDSTNKIVISGDFRTFANAPINTSNNGDEGALGNTDAGVDISIVDGNSLFTAGQRFRWPKSESYTDNTSGLEFAYDLKNEVIGGSYTDTEDLRHWDKGFNLNLRYLPKALGSYACGTAYDVNTGSVAVSNGIYPQAYLYTEQSIRFTAVKYQNSTYVLKTGTSCTINITKLDSDVIEGTYTAVMSDEDAAAVLPDGDGKISISGSFRHKITP
jgi:hypothetical protein